MAKQPAHKVRRRPGFFRPVPARARRDGWSAARQCAFLAHLYLTGSVTAAARAVGMTRESAHRLRHREGAESFDRAWDRVLAPPGTGRRPPATIDYRKVTTRTLADHTEAGFLQPVIYRGRMIAIRLKHDNTTLLRLLRRLDATALRVGEDGGCT